MSGNLPRGVTVQGKLPCGNPKRYGGREVVSMSHAAQRGTKRRTPSSANNVDDSDKTEAELHLQRLLEKQLKTDVTLPGHFLEHRSFTEATKHRPGVDELIGVHGYQDYKLASDLDAKIDFFRHCGLDDEEIAIKMGQDMGLKPNLELVGYGAEPESRAKRLKEIEGKIKGKEKQLQMPHSNRGALLLSRQRMELEASHSQRYGPKEDEIKSCSALVIKGTQVQPETSHPNDPINHIPLMLDELEGKTKGERESRRERRRRRKIEKRMQYYKQFEKDDSEPKDECLTPQSNSDQTQTSDDETCNDMRVSRLSEDKEVSIEKRSQKASSSQDLNNQDEKKLEHNEDNQEIGEATCALRPPGWISPKPEKRKRKKPLWPAAEEMIRQDIEFLSKDHIAENRLSAEEIVKMPKFENYAEGIPNRVLYVKNLPNQTTITDLMKLFGCFQRDPQHTISIKVLSGRMKGQGFVTFTDEVAAGEALNLVNGYLLYGSPVIVSYGKKT